MGRAHQGLLMNRFILRKRNLPTFCLYSVKPGRSDDVVILDHVFELPVLTAKHSLPCLKSYIHINFSKYVCPSQNEGVSCKSFALFCNKVGNLLGQILCIWKTQCQHLHISLYLYICAALSTCISSRYRGDYWILTLSSKVRTA